MMLILPNTQGTALELPGSSTAARSGTKADVIKAQYQRLAVPARVQKSLMVFPIFVLLRDQTLYHRPF